MDDSSELRPIWIRLGRKINQYLHMEIGRPGVLTRHECRYSKQISYAWDWAHVSLSIVSYQDAYGKYTVRCSVTRRRQHAHSMNVQLPLSGLQDVSNFITNHTIVAFNRAMVDDMSYELGEIRKTSIEVIDYLEDQLAKAKAAHEELYKDSLDAKWALRLFREVDTRKTGSIKDVLAGMIRHEPVA
jgi:hypothetical protein